MTRLPLLLTVCLLTACSSDDAPTTAQTESRDDCPAGYQCATLESFEWPVSTHEIPSDAVSAEDIACNALGEHCGGSVAEWRPVETAPKDAPVLISAGRDLPGGHKYRTTYIAYWAEFLSADNAKEWRDASTHQRLSHTAYMWMPVPKEHVIEIAAGNTCEIRADSIHCETDDISEPGGGLVYFTTTESSGSTQDLGETYVPK